MLHLLYNKYYIPANSYDHLTLSTRLSFKEFNEEGGDPSELLADPEIQRDVCIFPQRY